MSDSKGGYFQWYLSNSNSLCGVYVGNQTQYQSGSGMDTVELNTVSLISKRRNYVVYTYSCYTLIKIK